MPSSDAAYRQEWPECEHKWRAYEQIGVVCRDCGKAAPPEIARMVACHTEDAK